MTRLTFTRAAIIAALVLTSHAARAAEDEAQRIANNFSHENLICGVYHSLVSQCLANRDLKDGLVEQYQQTSMAFIERSVKIGRAAGLSEAALSARVDIAQQDMRSEIENSCTNIAVLLRKHAQQCKQLYENGPKMFTTELDRIEADIRRKR